MTKIKELFISSMKELKDVRCITLAAMFGALSIILGSFTVMVTENIKIEWTYLPNEFVYYLFGPFVGIFFGGAMDILNFIVRPFGTYFPGITLNAMLKGLIFGLILYKRPLSMKRIILANVIRAVFIDFLLLTYWLSILNGVPYQVLLGVRALKVFGLMPVEIILFYLLVKGVEASGILKILGINKSTREINVK